MQRTPSRSRARPSPVDPSQPAVPDPASGPAAEPAEPPESYLDADPDDRRRDDGFSAFYRREFGRTATLARSLSGGSWAVAEELAQDAFLVAHRKWGRVSRYDDPSQFVRRVVVNHAVSAHRRRQAERRALARTGRPPAATHDPTGQPGAAHGSEAMLALLADLPPKQRQALALVYVDQLDPRDAAALLGCTESTLRTHLQRGREALRSLLDTKDAR